MVNYILDMRKFSVINVDDSKSWIEENGRELKGDEIFGHAIPNGEHFYKINGHVKTEFIPTLLIEIVKGKFLLRAFPRLNEYNDFVKIMIDDEQLYNYENFHWFKLDWNKFYDKVDNFDFDEDPTYTTIRR